MFSYKVLSDTTWADFEDLFGRHNGVRGGCWCMFHRVRASEFNKLSAEERKLKQKQNALSGRGCGIIIYDDDYPVAWCQVGEAGEFPFYDYSKAYSELEIADGDKPKWRISCMFVDKKRRSEHIASYCLDSAIEHIANSGGGVTEAFPINPGKSGRPAYAGSRAMFEKRGFEYITRLGSHTYLVRKHIKGM